MSAYAACFWKSKRFKSLRMAEREGFEPSMGVAAHTPLAGERLQPLGHLSGGAVAAGFATIARCPAGFKPVSWHGQRVFRLYADYIRGFSPRGLADIQETSGDYGFLPEFPDSPGCLSLVV